MRLQILLLLEFVLFALLSSETLRSEPSVSEESLHEETIKEGVFGGIKDASTRLIRSLLRRESRHPGRIRRSESNVSTQTHNEPTGHSNWPASRTKDLSEYISQGGGQLHPYLKVNDTYHGGATIRGIITTGPLEAGTIILRVPRKLWVLDTSFPLVLNKTLDRSKSCQGHNLNLKRLKYGTALALEKRKGKASHFSTYLETMPSHFELSLTLPRLASQEVLRDFQALPLVGRIRRQQQEYGHLEKCYQEWQQSEPELTGLPWEEVLSSIFGETSRNFGIKDGEIEKHALIVFADLVNTGPGEEPNVIWEAPSQSQHPGEFAVKVKRDLLAGDELIDDYCADCTNNDMVYNWGIYLEGNPNRLKAEDARRVNCNDEGMHKAAMKTLSLEGSHVAVPDVTAPRCEPHVWKQDNGGVRCSLARLAWEYCGCLWEGRVCPTGFAENLPVQAARLARHARRARSHDTPEAKVR